MALDLFNKRGKEDRERFGERLPPGQKLTDGWPVLHYGGIPPIDLAMWKFSVVGLVEEEVHFTWDEFMALPQTTLRSDIHCVTHWSKFDNDWTGVKFSDVLSLLNVKPEAKHVMLHCYGGYTTNVSLAELMDDDVLFARTRTTASRWRASTAGRCGWLCRSCTSGRARSGCVAWCSWMKRRRGSGRCTGTTSTAIRGRRRGTRSSQLAVRSW